MRGWTEIFYVIQKNDTYEVVENPTELQNFKYLIKATLSGENLRNGELFYRYKYSFLNKDLTPKVITNNGMSLLNELEETASGSDLIVYYIQDNIGKEESFTTNEIGIKGILNVLKNFFEYSNE